MTATIVATEDKTTITVHTEYKSREARDIAMQPGFEEGFDASYLSLDALFLKLAL